MVPENIIETPQWHWLPWSPGRPAEDAVRAWLAPRLGRAAGAIALSRDAHGRPRLDDGDADVSWSHSGDGLVLAFGRGVVLGIDVECERRRPRALELAQRYFTADETAWLQAHLCGTDREIAFLRLWCAKEAVLKAHGRGLAFGLHRLAFAECDGALALVDADPALGDARQWHVQEFIPEPGYRAAMAWKRAAPTQCR